jgi:NAD(P)H-dependent flavin oxidoreductase YrpB (nitropropane dioxygenase family)
LQLFEVREGLEILFSATSKVAAENYVGVPARARLRNSAPMQQLRRAKTESARPENTTLHEPDWDLPGREARAGSRGAGF